MTTNNTAEIITIDSEDESTQKSIDRVLLRKMALSDPDFRSIFPSSVFDDFVAPAPITTELELLNHLKSQDSDRSSQPKIRYLKNTLNDFRFYKAPNKASITKGEEIRPELLSPHMFRSLNSNMSIYFDGVISTDEKPAFLQGIDLDMLRLESASSRNKNEFFCNVYVHSKKGHLYTLLYKLGSAASDFKPYWQFFEWLATFTKQYMRFLSCNVDTQLSDFKLNFYDWLHEQFSGNQNFLDWFSEYGSKDFCPVVNHHIGYLKTETSQRDETLLLHSVFSDCRPQGPKSSGAQHKQLEMTAVTPYVDQCFGQLFPGCLEVMQPRSTRPKPADKRRRRPGTRRTKTDAHEELNLSDDEYFESKEAREANDLNTDDKSFPSDFIDLTRDLRDEKPKETHSSPPITMAVILKNLIQDKEIATIPLKIEAGTVVATLAPDGLAYEQHANLRFAYVQAVHHSGTDDEVYDVLWLNAPQDTSCRNSFYPHDNELFLSRKCSCGEEGYNGPVESNEVICVVPTILQADPDINRSKMVIRQIFDEKDDGSFKSFSQKDLKCQHRQKIIPSYQNVKEEFTIGDTVLVSQSHDSSTYLGSYEKPSGYHQWPRLSVAVIDSFIDQSERIGLRKLRRRELYGSDSLCVPNELVWTNNFYQLGPASIIKRCKVRFYSLYDRLNNHVPAPYNRGGTGNLFILTYEEALEGKFALRELACSPGGYKEGYDPKNPLPPGVPPLSGIEVFCGGGNYSRGIEEAGAVRTAIAVDNNPYAIATHKANALPGSSINWVCQSCNRYIKEINRDKFKYRERYKYMCLMAGCPCQGFSLANRFRMNGPHASESSLSLASLTASSAAFVDLLRPAYAVLENVPNMTNNSNEQNDTLAQLIACLVGMGYQVRTCLADAWAYGSAQNRTRVILLAARSDFILPVSPDLSHQHHPKVKSRRLGQTAHGSKYGARWFEHFAFRQNTASSAISDLPDIGNGHVRGCIKYPDHVIVGTEPMEFVYLMTKLPRDVPKQGLRDAVQRGYLQPDAFDFDRTDTDTIGPKQDKRWTRMDRDGSIPTVVTSLNVRSKFSSAFMHWTQNRPMTLMEARRAQNFPDDEVIIGSLAQAMRIVGNSVDRSPSNSFGLVIRDAYIESVKRLQLSASSLSDLSDVGIQNFRLLGASHPNFASPSGNLRHEPSSTNSPSSSIMPNLSGNSKPLPEHDIINLDSDLEIIETPRKRKRRQLRLASTDDEAAGEGALTPVKRPILRTIDSPVISLSTLREEDSNRDMEFLNRATRSLSIQPPPSFSLHQRRTVKENVIDLTQDE
jgi:DNA (cytosine-5)-methyltransferase 1